MGMSPELIFFSEPAAHILDFSSRRFSALGESRRLVAAQRPDLPESSVALDMEVQLRSKARAFGGGVGWGGAGGGWGGCSFFSSFSFGFVGAGPLGCLGERWLLDVRHVFFFLSTSESGMFFLVCTSQVCTATSSKNSRVRREEPAGLASGADHVSELRGRLRGWRSAVLARLEGRFREVQLKVSVWSCGRSWAESLSGVAVGRR